ncbi:hypothetical protein [Bacillus cereus]|nr:hypothetical protein [Bacillus cereus]
MKRRLKELAAFSIEYLDAEGMYMAPGERSDVFMAVLDKVE